MQTGRVRILLVDDHPAVLKGLAATLGPEPDMEVVAVASSAREAVDSFALHHPDITIMDIRLGGGTGGIEAIRQIRRVFAQARIIVFSALTDEETIYSALQSGAATFLFKDTLCDELVKTIRAVHANNRPIPAEVARKLADRVGHAVLTARELEVLRLVGLGLRNKEIGAALGITEDTAQGHVKNILAKLHVNDRTRAVTLAAERGIIHLS
ncbi:MAG TPA: response regulator transcription factor [Candidatus Angelobacter sp.]|nr:response regulator transcription factor [Candidatus Angelobacter sp.]